MKVKFTPAQLRLLTDMRHAAVEWKPFYVSNASEDVAMRMWRQGLLIFDGYGPHGEGRLVRLTKRGRYVADEQIPTIASITQRKRYTFSMEELEKLSDEGE